MKKLLAFSMLASAILVWTLNGPFFSTFMMISAFLLFTILFAMLGVVISILFASANMPKSPSPPPKPKPKKEYDEEYENEVAMTNLYINHYLDNDD